MRRLWSYALVAFLWVLLATLLTTLAAGAYTIYMPFVGYRHVLIPTLTYTPPSLTPTYTPTPYTPVATVSPDLVEILNNHTTYTSPWWKHIVGEVRNKAPFPLGFVTIRARLYDEGNNLTHETAATVLTHRVEPGVDACFNIPLPKDATWARYELSVIGAAGPVAPLPRLTILNTNPGMSPYGTFQITGTVRNDQGVSVRSVVVVATLYDVAGKVIDCARTVSPVYYPELAPGATWDFTIVGGRPGAVPAEYMLIADGYY